MFKSYENLVCVDLGLRGPDLLDYIIEQIDLDPERWNQRYFHTFNCKSSHCIAGFAQVFCGVKPPEDSLTSGGVVSCDYAATCFRCAQTALGLDNLQATWLFAAHRTLGQIKLFAKRFRENKHCFPYGTEFFNVE
jgi:hypothetical protein